jgi:hypothetical protein
VDGSTRRKSYKADLGVRPTHPDDPRCWYLPETAGEVRLAPALPWRTHNHQANKLTPGSDLAIVANVAREVEKLSVNEKGASVMHDKGRSDTASTPTPPEGQHPLTAFEAMGTAAPTSTLLLVPEASTNKTTEATDSSFQAVPALLAGTEETREVGGANDKVVVPPSSEASTWKRCTREVKELQRKDANARTTHGHYLGATRQSEEEDEPSTGHAAKKILLQVPSLEVCLGKEGLRTLKEQEGQLVAENVMGLAAKSCQVVNPVVCESLDVLVDSRDDHRAIGRTGEMGLQPARVEQLGDTRNNMSLKGTDYKKTEPDTDGIEPGTDEGA